VSIWKIAGVQMDCRLADKPANMEAMQARLREAAGMGARLILFPECILSGYGYGSKEQAWQDAESIPGPATESFASACRELRVWAGFGMLERDEATGRLFNSCALVGPAGELFSYRKLHLPCLGVDRFVTPGDRPLAVHDLGGLKVGMNICYDGSFPEASRVLALAGADLILLPTNWPTGAACTADYLPAARALENRVYYMAVDRIGDEEGFHFIGKSCIHDCTGDLLAGRAGDGPAVLTADIDPTRARRKRIVHIPGVYEIDRLNDRRPDMYGALTQGKGT
jgi:5-aminopentanamidase